MGVIMSKKLTYEKLEQRVRQLEKEKQENKNIVEELVKSQKYFRSLLHNAQDGVVTVDSSRRVLDWNPGAQIIFGYSSDEAKGRNFEDLIRHPDVKQEVYNNTNQILSGQIVKPMESVRYRKDGNSVHVRISVAPIIIDGVVKGAVILYTDISERKKAEEDLNKSEQNYRDIVEQTSDLITKVNKKGRITFVNHMSQEIFGLSPHECVGMSAFDFVHPSDKKYTQKWFNDMVAMQKVKGKIENRQVGKNGKSHNMLWTCNLLYDSSGNIIEINGTAKDITERKKLQEDTLKARKLESLGEMAGGIAHDFNNLLYMITGNISLAQDDLNPETRTSEALKNAEEACFKAKNLTAKLITFSKGGAPVKKIASIKELLKASVGSALKESDIKTEISIVDNVRKANIDENQIKHVIHNIVVNAKESMDNKGQLKATCENIDIDKDNQRLSHGKYIKITVKDQGCGIPEEILKKIFDPYFSTKEIGHKKGQGLGLGVSHSIVEKHNGLITVESDLKKGSIFSIYLPAMKLSKTENSSVSKEKTISQKPLNQSITGKNKILVMDDEEMIRNLMSRFLNKLGYDVETCTEGGKAVEIYKNAMESKKPFNIAILDLTNKSGMGGQETMKRLLEIDPAVKGIIITGYSSDSVVENYKAYGFSGILQKPSTTEALQKVINEVLSKD